MEFLILLNGVPMQPNDTVTPMSSCTGNYGMNAAQFVARTGSRHRFKYRFAYPSAAATGG